MGPRLERIQKFFFEASLRGWVAPKGEQVIKNTIRDLPGSEVFEYDRYELRYIDCYFVNGRASWGFTQIWEDDIPVWWMTYNGACLDQRAIPVVKAALRAAYENGEFNCGRGPTHFSVPEFPGLSYSNFPENYFKIFTSRGYGDAGFLGFGGDERILNTLGNGVVQCLFYHHIQGGALIADKE